MENEDRVIQKFVEMEEEIDNYSRTLRVRGKIVLNEPSKYKH